MRTLNIPGDLADQLGHMAMTIAATAINAVILPDMHSVFHRTAAYRPQRDVMPEATAEVMCRGMAMGSTTAPLLTIDTVQAREFMLAAADDVLLPEMPPHELTMEAVSALRSILDGHDATGQIDPFHVGTARGILDNIDAAAGEGAN